MKSTKRVRISEKGKAHLIRTLNRWWAVTRCGLISHFFTKTDDAVDCKHCLKAKVKRKQS